MKEWSFKTAETKAHTLLLSGVSISAAHGSRFQKQKKQVLDLSQVRNDHAMVWVSSLLNRSPPGTALSGMSQDATPRQGMIYFYSLTAW